MRRKRAIPRFRTERPLKFARSPTANRAGIRASAASGRASRWRRAPTSISSAQPFTPTSTREPATAQITLTGLPGAIGPDWQVRLDLTPPHGAGRHRSHRDPSARSDHTGRRRLDADRALPGPGRAALVARNAAPLHGHRHARRGRYRLRHADHAIRHAQDRYAGRQGSG